MQRGLFLVPEFCAGGVARPRLMIHHQAGVGESKMQNSGSNCRNQFMQELKSERFLPAQTQRPALAFLPGIL
jgi:hypothetical protein